MSQYPPQLPASRGGFQSVDPAYQRPSEDHVVNIPLTPIEPQRTKDEASTGFGKGSTDKVLPDFERGATDQTLELSRKKGGRRRLLKNPPVAGDDDNTLTKMGQLYEKILNFSFLTRWLIYIAPLALLLAVPIIVGSTAAPQAELGGVRIVWIFAWAEVVWCSLWASKIVAKCLPWIFKTLVGVVSSGTRKYYKVIQKLELPLSILGWTFASWLSFIPIMTRNPDKRLQREQGDLNAFDTQAWQQRLNQILAACLVSSLVFLIKCIIVQLISVQYHTKQFSGRIAQNKECIRVLTTLLECSRHMFPSYCPEFAEEDYILHAGLASGLGTPGGNVSGSQTPMKFFHQIGRVGDNITSAVGHVAKEITGRNVLNPNASRSIVVDALSRKATIEALGRRIWMSFVEEGKDTLYEEDFIEVLGLDQKDEAKMAFALIDKDGNGDIALDEMIGFLMEVARERKTLAKSMGDIDSAIRALDTLLSAIVFIIVIFVFLAFMNESFVTTLATAGTALLSLSFVFAVTAQEILGSCVFIFVKHPYDVGDRIDIDTKEFIVEHISLLYTIFRHVETNKFVQVPNNVLNSKWVENVSRSQAMREVVKFEVHFETSMRDIMLLRAELMKFVEENNRDFRHENLNVEISGLKLDSLELRVEIKHKGNWADEPKRLERRNKFMAALVAALRKIPIYGPNAGSPALGEAGNAQFIVQIDPQEANRRKGQADQEKEAKRYKTPEELEEEEAAVRKSQPAIITTAASTTDLAGLGSQHAGASTADPRDETLMDDNNSLLSHTQSLRRGDIDQVRDIMRRQSTRGRRRRAGSQSTETADNAMSPASGVSTGIALYPVNSRTQPPSPLVQQQPQAQGIYQQYQTYGPGPAGSAGSAYQGRQYQSHQAGPSVPQPPPAPLPPGGPPRDEHRPAERRM